MARHLKLDHLSGRAHLSIDGPFSLAVYRGFPHVIDHPQDKARHLGVDLRRPPQCQAACMDTSAPGLPLQMCSKLKDCTRTLAIKRDRDIDEVLSVTKVHHPFARESD